MSLFRDSKAEAAAAQLERDRERGLRAVGHTGIITSGPGTSDAVRVICWKETEREIVECLWLNTPTTGAMAYAARDGKWRGYVPLDELVLF